MYSTAVLISIHPDHAEKIVSGEKHLEFRRSWAVRPVDTLIVYTTAHVKKIVAVATITEVFWGSRTRLWNLAKTKRGAISRRELFKYFEGKKCGFAIEMAEIRPIPGGLDPKLIFGRDFRPPQSFRYLTEMELVRLNTQMNRQLAFTLVTGAINPDIKS